MSSTQDPAVLQPGPNRLTPEIYARLVRAYAKRSTHPLYPGQHYSALARLLISEYQRYSTEGDNLSIGDALSIPVYLYDLAISAGRIGRRLSFDTVEQLKQYDDETWKRQAGGRLVFLQGYMSPQWLNHIGAKFEVDPEFYVRHLDFSSSQPSPEHYPILSLPSCTDIVRVRITSIVSWNDFQPSSRESTAQLRSLCENQMSEYLKSIAKGQSIEASDSIVRRFSVHDRDHFSLEQFISIHVILDGPGWTAIIWLDQGRDIRLSHHGPWAELQRGDNRSLSVHPIFQYRKRIALRNESSCQNKSASLDVSLASAYGSSLRPDLMGSDLFYALDELFRLAIASESQFLTFLSHKIKLAVAQDSISDLQYSLSLISDHREHVRELISLVRDGGHANWPKAPEAEQLLRATTHMAKESLQKDLEHLLAFADHMAARCTSGISVMMNEAMFRQSQRAIDQTNATIKLSFLVFLFAPLSVTTSFFSMDVKEVKHHELSVWAWAAASAVMMALSFVLWKWEVSKWIKTVWIWLYVLVAPTSARYRK